MPGKTRCLELGPIPEVPIRYQDETQCLEPDLEPR